MAVLGEGYGGEEGESGMVFIIGHRPPNVAKVNVRQFGVFSLDLNYVSERIVGVSPIADVDASHISSKKSV
ncbi:unnamed protein product [Nippostrongylus brasiliensis]|uniref:Dirigent protein n=1 Tax=Nippostrongylus brasiliensis TaxID=27835 RepID=A0A0N4YFC2_NIPBR|nr:unnamed protein product [Nippostrongylus brasiliensis]